MRSLSAIVLLFTPVVGQAQKDAAVKSASAIADSQWPTALKLWEWAEPGYQEK